MKVIKDEQDVAYASVAEFSRLTGRFNNQIYDLINHGNAYGKLSAKKINNKWYVKLSEKDDYPFNAAKATELKCAKKVERYKKRIDTVQAERDALAEELAEAKETISDLKQTHRIP